MALWISPGLAGSPSILYPSSAPRRRVETPRGVSDGGLGRGAGAASRAGGAWGNGGRRRRGGLGARQTRGRECCALPGSRTGCPPAPSGPRRINSETRKLEIPPPKPAPPHPPPPPPHRPRSASEAHAQRPWRMARETKEIADASARKRRAPVGLAVPTVGRLVSWASPRKVSSSSSPTSSQSSAGTAMGTTSVSLSTSCGGSGGRRVRGSVWGEERGVASCRRFEGRGREKAGELAECLATGTARG